MEVCNFTNYHLIFANVGSNDFNFIISEYDNNRILTLLYININIIL